MTTYSGFVIFQLSVSNTYNISVSNTYNIMQSFCFEKVSIIFIDF